MLIYLLKSSACLAIFMIFYKLILEKTSAHKLKRFYLLSALGLAFVIPFMTFIEYVEPVISELQLASTTNDFMISDTAIIEEKVNYLPGILFLIYGTGALFFLIKFCVNLTQIISRIKHNPKFNSNPFINVLVKNLAVPHTFFNYIFLNEHKFETNDIPTEVILHEQTHAKQKHSLDIIILELLQIAFWFNPLIYFIKKDIKLNHEFLADSAVLKNGIQPSTYQNIILAFSSKATNHQLANAINYSSIKKRFTVMNTRTSKASVWFRSLLLLPLIAFTLYGFSEKIEVEKETSLENSLEESVDNPNTDKAAYYKYVTFMFKDTNGKVIATKSYYELTQEEKDRLLPLNKQIKRKSPTQSDLNRWKDSKTYGVWYGDKQISNSSLDTFSPSDFSLFNESKLEKNAVDYGKYFRQVNLYSNMYFNEHHKNDAAYLSKNTVITIIQNDTQKTASSKEVSEYNKLAKQYNAQPKDKRIIKLKDIERLETLYGLMSVEQKKNAQPFPECPPQPPAPPKVKKDNHTKTGFIKINGAAHYFVKNDNSTKYYNIKGFEVSKSGKILSASQINASDVIPGQYITKVYSNDGVVAEFKKNKQNEEGVLNIPPPPKEPKVPKTPKAPKVEKAEKAPKAKKDSKQKKKAKAEKKTKTKSIQDKKAPLPTANSTGDHIVGMAKKNAEFYYQGRVISSDRAIRLYKKNNTLNIVTKNNETNKPKVFLSTGPKTTNNRVQKELPKPNRGNIISHVKVMNRHGAKFFIEQKEVTFKDALKHLRQNKDSDLITSYESNNVIIYPRPKLVGVLGKRISD